ncbi:hypothetical protein [Silanimonas sp.]|jgi:hypothetical protein|uniref:hypothetical protein n=1 Tax=Silanimonas sp. TaxID=1929290 RepID=UPI0022C033CF|nr:hypothetical protein [Silanimonas sp.]MCZ8165987.1 hypothetical protein [Silanimonas sp.]
MPDVGHTPPPERALPIAEALRALPLEAPPRSAWPGIAAAAKLDQPRRPVVTRWPYAFATAAALALALMLPVPGDVPGGETDAIATDAAGDTTTPVDLPALMQESARLERLIAAVNDDPLQPADALVLGLAFEDELAGIDDALATAPRGSRDAQELWQQRIDTLSRYAELQSSRRLLASAGQPFETTLVALH